MAAEAASVVPEAVRTLCACPACRGTLTWDEADVGCESCGARYALAHGSVPILLRADAPAPAADPAWYAGGSARLLPPRLRRFAERHRERLTPVLTHKSPATARLVAEFVERLGEGAVVLNVGAGETSYGATVVNLDVAPLRGVAVVGTAEDLPIRDGCVDGVILQAVLEHVESGRRTLAEIHRVLKPGGAVLVEVPFMQGFHAGPKDYRRYTEPGLRAELEEHGFDVEASGVAVGPASAMAWITAEFLALLLSGKNATAYRAVRPLVGWVAVPLKYLDSWLDRHPMAYTIASGVWVRASRPG